MRPFKVGVWRVEPDLNQISRHSQRRNLRPKVMELLVYLAERRGRVVSIDELLGALWSQRIVTGSSVYRCVGELRDALDVEDEQQAYIDTIPKKGYRLLAPVAGIDTPMVANRRWLIPKWSLAAPGAILLVVLFAVWTSNRPRTELTAADFEHRSIAVLPFENLSADPDDTYFADGMHNDLLTQLAKIDGLKVISRTSVLEYRRKPRNAQDIGRELDVSTILEGSVQKVGPSVRLNVQLIDTETDGHIWAEVYDRKFTAENVFSIQRDITSSIAQALEATLSPEAVARINQIPTDNTRAYDFYLSGNEFLARSDTRTSIPLAVTQFRRAVTEDPEFALAWVALADAHTAMFSERFLDRSEARLQMVRESLQRAVKLAPNSPEVYVASGAFRHVIGDYENALADYDRAEQGLPGDVRLHWRRAVALERAGRWGDAVAAWARAVEFDPKNVGILQGQAMTFIFLRSYEQAEQIYTRILELRPDLSEARLTRDAIIPFLRDGDFTAVQSALQHPMLESLDDNLRNTFGWFAAIYARDYATALQYIQNWEADEFGRLFGYLFRESFLGATYRLAGEKELANQNFRQAVVLIDAAILEIERRPPKAIPEEYAILLTAKAEALAGLGMTEKASVLAHQAIEMMPYTKDAVWASILRHDAIRKVLVTAGDYDAAILQLETYLAAPGRRSVESIARDPHMDPIRNDRRFVALVEKYKRRGVRLN